MRTFYLIQLLSASCCAALAQEATNRVDAFSKLKQGDTLVVRFHASGCYHDSVHEFTFRRGSELTVSVVQLPSESIFIAVTARQTNRVDLGSLMLTKSDIAGLDRLMEFYRSKHDTMWTTGVLLSFTQQSDGQTVATEQITDGSCQTYDMKGLTRF